MKRVTVAILMALLASPMAGTAFSDDAPGGAPAKDCLAGGISTCMLMTPNGNLPAEARAARRASGVITRGTGTDGRYAVREISGFFGARSPVSIFTPQGDFVAKGTIHSIFDDELYVDVEPGAATPVAVGFPVLMNYTADDGSRFIASSRDTFNCATTEAKADARKIQQEIAADARKETDNRERWQEDMEKMKLQLGFYENRYYYYYPPY